MKLIICSSSLKRAFVLESVVVSVQWNLWYRSLTLWRILWFSQFLASHVLYFLVIFSFLQIIIWVDGVVVGRSMSQKAVSHWCWAKSLHGLKWLGTFGIVLWCCIWGTFQIPIWSMYLLGCQVEEGGVAWCWAVKASCSRQTWKRSLMLWGHGAPFLYELSLGVWFALLATIMLWLRFCRFWINVMRSIMHLQDGSYVVG